MILPFYVYQLSHVAFVIMSCFATNPRKMKAFLLDIEARMVACCTLTMVCVTTKGNAMARFVLASLVKCMIYKRMRLSIKRAQVVCR